MEQSENPVTPSDAPAAESSAADALREKVVEMIKTCYDPEIPVNIYDLGLIYNIDVDDDMVVRIRMTLTSPACPVAGSLPPEVADKVRMVEGVKDVTVDLVWEPQWNMSLMTEAAKLKLNLM